MYLTELANTFNIANALAPPAWLWLVIWMFLPKTPRLKTRYAGLFVPLVLAVIYAVTVMVHFSSAEGGFDSLGNVMTLFDHPGAALAGWVHYLSFDLIVGWAIASHGVANKVNRPLVITCLVATFMFGPVGLLLYAIVWLSHLAMHPGPTDAKPGKEASLLQSQHPSWRSTATDNIWQQICGGQIALFGCAVALLLSAPFLLLAYNIDTRTVLEINTWMKPIKFTASLFVYTLTLSWFCNYLPENWRNSKVFNRFTTLVIASIALEILWLIFAASIGEKAHFNRTHPILTPTYSLMGIIAVILTTQSLVIGIGIGRNTQSGLRNLTRYTLSLGLIANFALTLITAGYMSAKVGHEVLPAGLSAVSEVDAVKFIGWLRAAGDLRVAHFFASHAMHFVPFVGFFLARTLFADTNSQRDRSIAIAITVAYSTGVAAVLIQAQAGQPFIPF